MMLFAPYVRSQVELPYYYFPANTYISITILQLLSDSIGAEMIVIVISVVEKRGEKI